MFILRGLSNPWKGMLQETIIQHGENSTNYVIWILFYFKIHVLCLANIYAPNYAGKRETLLALAY
jgi:hypothetical protein